MNIDRTPAKWDFREGKSMLQAITHVRLPLCITDPNLPDNPIVFANSAFSDLTGYPPDEVVGRNCRFLQGDATTPESIDAIRAIIENRVVDTAEILNYRKDGSTFLNALQLGPILDDRGKLLFFFGSQLDISERREVEQRAQQLADQELLHRLRNIVNVMSAIIRITGRESRSAADLSEDLIGRLSALSEAHFKTISGAGTPEITINELARTLLVAYAPLGTRQVSLSGEDRPLPGPLLSPTALMLHELATNAVKHGALSVAGGSVALSWEVRQSGVGPRLVFCWQESNGPEVVPPERRSGSSIIQKMVTVAGGTIEYRWNPEGVEIDATFPL